MSDTLKTVFGIDLGTTYSCLAYMDESGRVVIEPNAENERITPSVVYFIGDGKQEVGKVAKEHAEIYPDRVAMLFKRMMSDPTWTREIDGTKYKPQELSGYVLKKVVADAQAHTKMEIKDVVITCPAWFGADQRNATREAGVIAGLNVRAILNEPTAAAISYGMESAKDETVLVYDLGGGTFDITMIDINDNEIHVVCTGGDHMLGGRNWDDRIVDYLVEQACPDAADAASLRQDGELMQGLYLKAESAKQTLSRLESMNIPVTTCSGRAKIEVTRATFERLTSDLLDSTISLTREMLDRAVREREKRNEKNLNRGFDKILLVGGSTKMPQVEARLREEFKVPCEAHDQDEAVARGAAIFGHKLAIDDEIKYVENQLIQEAAAAAAPDSNVEEAPAQPTPEQTQLAEQEVRKKFSLPGTRRLVIKDVASHTYGIVVMDGDAKLVVTNLILRNTPVPASAVFEAGLVQAGQRIAELRVVENDSDDAISPLDESAEIVAGELQLPPGLPIDTKIPVTFSLTTDGQLTASAKEEASGNVVEVHAKVAGAMTPEEIAAATKRVSGLRL